MTDPVAEHKSQAPDALRCAAVTVSDTRTKATDRGGALLTERLATGGHFVVSHEIVPDEPRLMRAHLDDLLSQPLDAILLTGGTGISARDQTFETVNELFDKALPGYGELFRMLSYHEIGAAAMLSRATGGVVRGVVLLTMPGSPKAVALAMNQLILPELPHLVREARKSS